MGGSGKVWEGVGGRGGPNETIEKLNRNATTTTTIKTINSHPT